VIAAFVPRIPDKSPSLIGKRRRSAHPDPRKWSTDQAMAVWGEKVRAISDKEYELKHETYKSGLVLKHLPPLSITIADAPLDIGPFLSARYLSDLPFYSSLVF
jgi:hypothetical protein